MRLSFQIIGVLLLALFVVFSQQATTLSTPKYCLQRKCAYNCPLGFRSDDRGCPTCSCTRKSEALADMVVQYTTRKCFTGKFCKLACLYGFKTNALGCPICACKERSTVRPVCGPTCRIACPYGRVYDARGCPTCRCLGRPICPQFKCSRFCEYGYVKRNGCDTCICKEKPVPMVPFCKKRGCGNRCPFGYETDSTGCPTCTCIAKW